MYTFHPVLPSFRLSSPSSSSAEFLANYPSLSRVAHTVGIIWTTTRQSDLSYGSDEYLCTYRWKKRNRCVKYWGTGNEALNHATINTHSQLFPSPVHERWRSHTAFFWTHPSPHNTIPFGSGLHRELQQRRRGPNTFISAPAASVADVLVRCSFGNRINLTAWH